MKLTKITQNAYVNSKNIELSFDWANPLATSSVNVVNSILPPGNTASSISLIGNVNHLIINKVICK